MSEKIISLCYASNRTNRPVGRIIKKKINGIEVIVLTKSLRTRHMLQKPPAICYDNSIVEQAKACGVTVLSVRNVETKCTYTIPFDRFLKTSFKVNRGFGEQLGACLSEWDSGYPHINICKYPASRDAEQPKPAEPPKPAIIQPSLWDAGKVVRNWIQPETFRIASLIS